MARTTINFCFNGIFWSKLDQKLQTWLQVICQSAIFDKSWLKVQTWSTYMVKKCEIKKVYKYKIITDLRENKMLMKSS